MQDNLMISVILPVFNGEKYLSAAIDSILCQTYANFELIIINDGSTDGTPLILHKYSQIDSRIVPISRNNKGLVYSLNEGIAMAKGTWIARMDHDDISHPQRFEKQLEWLNKTGADICGSWVNIFGQGQDYIHRYATNDAAIKYELLFGCAFAHPSVIVKKGLIKSLGYRACWEKAEDYDLWVRAAIGGWKMSNVPEVLLNYRQHGSQLSHESKLDQQDLTQKVRKFYWESSPLTKKFNQNEIEAMLNLRERTPSKPKLFLVNSVCMRMVINADSEVREVIFDHLTRLYYRIAALSFLTPFCWYSLNQKLGKNFELRTFVSLLLLSIFRVKTHGVVFQALKRYYLKMYTQG